MLWVVLFVIVTFIVIGIIVSVAEADKVAQMDPSQRRQHEAMRQEQSLIARHGLKNVALKCPHCGEKGHVRTKPIDMKKGVSGAKATGALLTGGVSLLATGLSRKEKVTQAHCDNCTSDWMF